MVETTLVKAKGDQANRLVLTNSQVVADAMPATSDAVPLLGSYFNAMNFMVAASVVTTIMILNYHHRLADTHDMPAWVRTVFLHWIPWALRMSRRPGEEITRGSIKTREKMRRVESSPFELPPRGAIQYSPKNFPENCPPSVPKKTLQKLELNKFKK